MTPLKCDLCGSNDVVKDGEYFVCQHCGTKYTIETAKQMMFGGTVSIDTTNQVRNYLVLAKRAMSQGEDPKEFVDKALELAPNDPEVLETETQMKEQNCINDARSLSADDWNSFLPSQTSRITSFLDGLDEQKKQSVLDKLLSAFKEGIEANFQHLADSQHPSFGIDYLAKSIDNRLLKKIDFWKELGASAETIRELHEELASELYGWLAYVSDDYKFNYYFARCKDERDDIIYLLNKALSLTQSVPLKICINQLIIKYVQKYPKTYFFSDGEVPAHLGDIERNESLIKEAQNRLAELDPSYVKPKEEKTHSVGFCYVATAVYGSYDCPEVWTLRRFRDYDLAETWYGRAFIRTYYAVSPAIVKWFGKTDWFSNMWRPVLDRMVASLKDKGYEDTPYDDRQW